MYTTHVPTMLKHTHTQKDRERETVPVWSNNKAYLHTDTHQNRGQHHEKLQVAEPLFTFALHCPAVPAKWAGS